MLVAFGAFTAHALACWSIVSAVVLSLTDDGSDTYVVAWLSSIAVAA